MKICIIPRRSTMKKLATKLCFSGVDLDADSEKNKNDELKKKILII